jgi:hypothetical protein
MPASLQHQRRAYTKQSVVDNRHNVHIICMKIVPRIHMKPVRGELTDPPWNCELQYFKPVDSNRLDLSLAQTFVSTMNSLSSELIQLKYPRPKSGPFVYHVGREHDGDLTVDDISRCDTDRLMSLLTYEQPPPLLTKKGQPRARQPSPHKDKTGRFYSAQCAHYGLRITSNKQAAKARLLKFAEANGGKFIVPPEVKELETKLAAEYDIEMAIYNAKRADIEARMQKEADGRREKRKMIDDELDGLLSKKPKYDATAVSYRHLHSWWC